MFVRNTSRSVENHINLVENDFETVGTLIYVNNQMNRLNQYIVQVREHLVKCEEITFLGNIQQLNVLSTKTRM